jgi:RimJ/RimL family protein N-acetyltransferase
LNFEQLKVSHAADIYRVWSDFDAVRFTNWTHTPTLELCSERLTKVVAFYAKEPLHFGPYVIRLADGRFVGIIGADLTNHLEREYDVWYFLCREERGKGIATQALEQLVSHLRASNRVKRATASAVTGNIASWKLLERLKFVRDLTVPAGHQAHGLICDIYNYSRDIGTGA